MMRQYDLVVAGTGFASTFFLKKYLEKAGPNVKVLVLERGELFTHKDRLNNIRGKKYGNVSYVTALKSSGKLFNNSKPNKPWIFDPNFGGSSNCWTGCTPRFMPADFKMKTLYNVGEDWPISYEELNPYYDEAEEIMSISGPSGTPFPKQKEYPLPPHKLSTFDKLLQSKYGDLYISQPTARASVRTNNRGQCCTSNICHLCPVNAKFTIENTLKSVYEDPRVELRYNAQAYALELMNDRVSKIHFKEGEKNSHIASDLFALGANAIYNAHILLNSGDTNSYTGRGLCEQLGVYVYVHLRDFNNVGGQSTITANGYMFYEGRHRKDYAAAIIESHNDPVIRTEPNKYRHIAKFKVVYEDLPQMENRVEVSEDPLVPNVHFNDYSEYTYRGLGKIQDQLKEMFSDLPVENFYIDSPVPSEAHLLASTRMGINYENSVVDKTLMHQKYRNLLILGGSVFPTISPSNPTLTLSALSLLAADKLI